MASPSQRRGSMDEPLNLSDSRSRLLSDADSFVGQFEEAGPRLRELAVAMTTVSEELKVLQGTAGALRTAGIASGGARATLAVALGLLVCAAPLVGGLGLAAAAAAAVLGGVVVMAVNVGKLVKKDGSAGEVEALGAEFLRAAGPLRGRLEEIRRRCAALGEEAAAAAGVQAAGALQELQELQEVLQSVARLRRRSRRLPAVVAAAVLDEVRGLLALVASVLRVTVRRHDATLAESVVQAAGRSLKVTTHLHLLTEQLLLLRRP